MNMYTIFWTDLCEYKYKYKFYRQKKYITVYRYERYKSMTIMHVCAIKNNLWCLVYKNNTKKMFYFIFFVSIFAFVPFVPYGVCIGLDDGGIDAFFIKYFLVSGVYSTCLMLAIIFYFVGVLHIWLLRILMLYILPKAIIL